MADAAQHLAIHLLHLTMMWPVWAIYLIQTEPSQLGVNEARLPRMFLPCLGHERGILVARYSMNNKTSEMIYGFGVHFHATVAIYHSPACRIQSQTRARLLEHSRPLHVSFVSLLLVEACGIGENRWRRNINQGQARDLIAFPQADRLVINPKSDIDLPSRLLIDFPTPLREDSSTPSHGFSIAQAHPHPFLLLGQRLSQ